jgi:hypothetical protein
MLRRAALVRTDVTEERMAPNIRVTRIGELGTMLQCHSDNGGDTFLVNYGSVRATRRNIPEDCILHCHLRENFKS